MSEQDLKSWLDTNKLSKLLGVLNENDIETLDDIKETLETAEGINNLAEEMKLKSVLKKKFVKAVMKLNNITEQSTSQAITSQVISQSGSSSYNDAEDEKKEEKEEKEPEEPKRKRLNIKGVHHVKTLRKPTVGKRRRTIMVIGATGVGKTRLLNSMMNYLWDVEYNDPYRFKLIYDTQTVIDDVTAYHLTPPALDYELTLIDTPGFGDSRGLQQDEKITKQIKKFFEQKIQEIDAICFVVKASHIRLTATQKYIFAQVLSIFGNDIADNILILMTFADGKKPPALAVLQAGKVPFKQYFKLNNSAFDLPEDDEEPDMFSQLFWKMGIKSFKKLFVQIDKLKTKSLQLTKQVLTRREELETYIESVQPMIRNGFTVLETLRRQIVVIQKYDDANSKKSVEEQIMARSVTELAQVEQDLNGLIKNIRDCLNELGKIALRPNVLSQDDYIDELIQSEEAVKKPGWQQRINALQGLKQKQDMLNKLNNDKYNPWAQYDDVRQFIGKHVLRES